MTRWLGFLLAITIGLAVGSYYAWVINPIRNADTTLASLRVDYKTDYVLMVAEAYHLEEDLTRAASRLAYQGNDHPAEIVRDALLYARQAGYSDLDMRLMRELEKAIQSWQSAGQ